MINMKEEASRCLLCADAACTRACKSCFDPATQRRVSIRKPVRIALENVRRLACIMICL